MSGEISARSTESATSTEFFRQLLQSGSVFEAICANKLDIKSFLHYLLQIPASLATLAAYRAICLEAPLIEQELSGGHFLSLTNNIDYVAIYFLLVTDRTYQDLVTRYPLLYVAKLRLLLDRPFYYRIIMICDLPDNEFPLQASHAELIIKCRCNCLFTAVKVAMARQDYIPYLFQADYVTEILKVPAGELLTPLKYRIQELRASAPLYWQEVGSTIYQKIVEEKYSTIVTGKVSQDEIRELFQYFPFLPVPEYLSYSKVAYRVATLPFALQQYYLGSRIVDEELPPAEVSRRLSLLNELSSFQNFLRDLSSGILEEEVDSLHEKIKDYLPFDIISFCQNGRRFYFTRPEFSHLIENQRNPWNNLKLPIGFINQLIARVETAKIYQLPDAKTIPELLAQLMN